MSNNISKCLIGGLMELAIIVDNRNYLIKKNSSKVISPARSRGQH